MADIFGLKRSIEPKSSLAQQAWKVDNTIDLRQDEILIDIKILSVNLVSFNEMLEETKGNEQLLKKRILEIVEERGKLHNPITNTGGMLYGTVNSMGETYPNKYKLKVGDEIISLVSLSITPVKIHKIISVNVKYAQVEIEGQAILYASSPIAKKPKDLSLRLAISALDEAGAPTYTYKIIKENEKVLVIGAGGRTGLLCGYASHDKLGSTGKLVGIVKNESDREKIKKYNLYDKIIVIDAANIDAVCYEKNIEFTGEFDVVINCINSANTEVASLIAVKNKGKLFFATLGCDYKFAGLTAESIGKEVDIIPYTGFCEGHAEYTLSLLRRFPIMQQAIEQSLRVVAVEPLLEDDIEGVTQAEILDNMDGYIFRSKESKEALRQAIKVARYNSNVMIYGESGVGKEIFARMIHYSSDRKSFPMIKINCAAIPENLLESELFGYEKGSFTGANQKGKIGLWEAAHNGTFFLDEIGEIPLSFQAKLLRVIQEKEIVRVGGISPIKVDVRIIAATNRDLASMVRQGLFREDLYYRLNVYPLNILPLRQRKSDIIPLAKYFVERYNKEFGLQKNLSPKTLAFLENQPFKGNIRELQNLIQRTMITTDYRIIEVRDVITAISYDQYCENGKPLAQEFSSKEEISSEVFSLKSFLAQQEAKILRDFKYRYKSTRKIAEMLQISQPSVVRKLNKYSISD